MKFKVLARSYLRPIGSKECFIFDPDSIYEAPPDYEPGPHLSPLDDEAKVAMEAYDLKKPGATITPVDQLPSTMSETVLQAAIKRALEDHFAKTLGTATLQDAIRRAEEARAPNA